MDIPDIAHSRYRLLWAFRFFIWRDLYCSCFFQYWVIHIESNKKKCNKICRAHIIYNLLFGYDMGRDNGYIVSDFYMIRLVKSFLINEFKIIFVKFLELWSIWTPFGLFFFFQFLQLPNFLIFFNQAIIIRPNLSHYLISVHAKYKLRLWTHPIMLWYFGTHIWIHSNHFDFMVLCECLNVLICERAGWIPGSSEVHEIDRELLDWEVLIH